MVIDTVVNKVLRWLEKYFIQQSGFRLLGKSYDLILISPSETSYSYPKYSWLISAGFLDNKSKSEAIYELLTYLESVLTEEEYSSIARLNVINSNQPIVNNLKLIFSPVPDEAIEITDYPVGGIRIEEAILLRSKFLLKAKEGNAVIFITNQGERIAAGIISIDKKFTIKHYSGKGLREIFKPETPLLEEKAKELKNKTEEFMVQNGYITFTRLEDIYTVV